MSLGRKVLVPVIALTLAACSNYPKVPNNPEGLHIPTNPLPDNEIRPLSDDEIKGVCRIIRGEAIFPREGTFLFEGERIVCPDPNTPSPPPAAPLDYRPDGLNELLGEVLQSELPSPAPENSAREGQTPTNVIPGLDITPLLQRSAPENPAREGQAPIATIPGLDITKLPEVQQLLGQSAPKPSSGHLNQFPPGPNDA